ncbi:MAG: type I DNA topoisomerase [Candidatus Omnitrophica bacterium]|nr:type I DNA topoisomerase [Candidatus Omnitrophota bacterium]
MAKRLVIVESPAKAGTINKILGKDYQVEASFGHIRDLPKSKMGVDPQNGFTPEYVIPTKSKKTVSKLKKLAKGKETIYLATDPDREGEAISWHLAEILRGEAPEIKRVMFNELTKEAVKFAFDHPRDIDLHLVNAQQARRVLDRIVGYELSPLLWRKVGRGLSAGRVQSVALRLVVEREEEIRKFKPEEYWSLHAQLSSERASEKDKIFQAKLVRIGKEKIHLKNEAETLKLKSILEKETFRIISIQKKERRRKPQAPYTTSKLQQEAYNRLGFSASRTMRIAQGLYEGVEIGEEGSVGLITYMRTDSVNIAEVAKKEAVKFVKERFGDDYLPKTPNIYRSKKGAQEAHEAIRPTSAYRDPDQIKQYLNEEQFKLYELIWRKFLSSQMTAAIDLVTTVEVLAGSEYFFRASGTRNLFPGFSAVFVDNGKTAKKEKEEGDKEEESDQDQDEDEEDQEFPDLEQNEILKLHELIGNQHFTKPPARYNDASLVKILEEEGIGRPSTYAPIIYTLVSRDYVERKSGAIIPTELGETVIHLLVEHFPYILDIQFTALMEEEFDKIEEGELEWVKVLQEFYQPFETHLKEAKTHMKNVRQEAIPTNEVCEKCGKPMVIKWGRFGKFVACSGFPACRNTKPISTGVACPKEGCGGYLVARKGKGSRKFYGCSNYPNCDYLSNQLPTQGPAPEASEEKPPEIEEVGEDV